MINNKAKNMNFKNKQTCNNYLNYFVNFLQTNCYLNFLNFLTNSYFSAQRFIYFEINSMTKLTIFIKNITLIDN